MSAIKSKKVLRSIFTIFVLSFCVAFDVLAQSYSPSVAVSIHDDEPDGLPDYFNNTPFTGLLRQQTSREDRAVLEFEVRPELVSDTASVSLNFDLVVNNSGGSQFREFSLYNYVGNGAADLFDFNSVDNFIETVALDLSVSPRGTYSIDVTSIMLQAIENEDTFIGFAFDPIGLDNFPTVLTDSTLEITEEGPSPIIISETGSLPAYTEYLFDIEASGLIDIDVAFEDTNSQAFVFLYDSDDNLLASELASNNSASLEYDTAGVADRFSIVIYNNSSTTTLFEVSGVAEAGELAPKPTPTPIPGNDVEVVSGTLEPLIEYNVEIYSGGGVIQVSAFYDNAESNIDLFLYDASGEMVSLVLDTNNPEILEYDTQGVAGNYTVVIYNNSGTTTTFEANVSF